MSGKLGQNIPAERWLSDSVVQAVRIFFLLFSANGVETFCI